MSISRSNSGVGSFIASNSSANQQVEIQLLKSREFVGPDLFQQSPGLARYRSAPSSFLGALLDPPPDVNSSGDESEALYSAIWTGPLDLNHKGSDDDMQFQTKQGISGYEITPPGGGGGSVVGSYTLGMENQVQVSMSTGNRIAGSTNLVRQSSSPAGVFNGFAVKGEELGNYRSKSVVSGVSSNHLNYSPCPSSSLRVMPSIPENRSMEDQQSRNGTSREFEASLSQGSWSESLFSDLKRDHDGNLKMFTAYNQSQSEETEKSLRPSLTHHLSLPKTFSNDNGDTEKLKFLQFQREVVPCQIRAKRGTSPVAFNLQMRRTRISEKMKKLQELFPNMDKQTSTADMLDLAVRYIKDLQMQVQTLKETKAKCICSLKST